MPRPYLLNQQARLFNDTGAHQIAQGVVLFRAVAPSVDWTREIDLIAAQAPFRHLVVPGGKTMSVAMTNCGALGWVSDASGYRYTSRDPASGLAWPPMPASFAECASQWAAMAGFSGFAPDACLINRYQPGAQMGLHQDRDEQDFTAPVISVSLGDDARFRIGGVARGGKTHSLMLRSGDVIVFGGPSRLAYHGIDRIYPGTSTLLSKSGRINLTLRRVSKA